MARNSSTSKIVTTGLAVAGGYAAGKAVSNLQFIQSNPLFAILAPVAGAIATPMLMGKGATAKSIAAGMVSAAATTAVAQYLPEVASQVGLAGVPYRTALTPGVAGRAGVGNAQAQYMPRIKF